jgi:hypothetical protein
MFDCHRPWSTLQRRTGIKEETIYVIAGSDAEAHVPKRFPAKRTKRVHNGLRPRSIDAFLSGLALTFQRGAAAGLDAVFHLLISTQPCPRVILSLASNARSQAHC